MLFKFQCPHCGQRISATSEDAGTHNVCPSCNKELVVPRSPAGNPVTMPPSLPPRPYSTRDLVRDCEWVSLAIAMSAATGFLVGKWYLSVVVGCFPIPQYFRHGRKGTTPIGIQLFGCAVVVTVLYQLKRFQIFPFNLGS